MSDRINTLTIVLDQPYRDDDVEQIVNAIRMIKGVASVTANVQNMTDHVAYDNARRDLGNKLWEVLYPEKNK